VKQQARSVSTLTPPGSPGYCTAKEHFLGWNMKKATLTSVCECQARLYAELSEDKQVILGWAKDVRRKKVATAPAHSIDSDRPIFDVAWSCPFCTRNTLRSFDTGGLAFRESANATTTTSTG
jgi:hypothetical protein